MISTGEDPQREADREAFPTPELACLLDDWERPDAVTVFAEDREGAWLRIDAEYAIDVETVP